MHILRGFFSEDLAIDLGTVNTIVYAPTEGVVLNEPSVLALHKYSGEVLSIGSQALRLLGREPNDMEVHRPIRRGAIDDFEISQKFLRTVISRVQHQDHPKRSHLVIGVPGSSTPLERRSVKDAARDAKAGRVDLRMNRRVSSSILVAARLMLPFSPLAVSSVPSACRRPAMPWTKPSEIICVYDTPFRSASAPPNG